MLYYIILTKQNILWIILYIMKRDDQFELERIMNIATDFAKGQDTVDE